MELVDQVRELEAGDVLLSPIGEARIKITKSVIQLVRIGFLSQSAQFALFGLREIATAHFMLPNGPGAQLRGPPPTLVELPGSDASEATTLVGPGRGPGGCTAVLGSVRAK